MNVLFLCRCFRSVARAARLAAPPGPRTVWTITEHFSFDARGVASYCLNLQTDCYPLMPIKGDTVYDVAAHICFHLFTCGTFLPPNRNPIEPHFHLVFRGPFLMARKMLFLDPKYDSLFRSFVSIDLRKWTGRAITAVLWHASASNYHVNSSCTWNRVWNFVCLSVECGDCWMGRVETKESVALSIDIECLCVEITRAHRFHVIFVICHKYARKEWLVVLGSGNLLGRMRLDWGDCFRMDAFWAISNPSSSHSEIVAARQRSYAVRRKRWPIAIHVLTFSVVFNQIPEQQ